MWPYYSQATKFMCTVTKAGRDYDVPVCDPSSLGTVNALCKELAAYGLLEEDEVIQMSNGMFLRYNETFNWNFPEECVPVKVTIQRKPWLDQSDESSKFTCEETNVSGEICPLILSHAEVKLSCHLFKLQSTQYS